MSEYSIDIIKLGEFAGTDYSQQVLFTNFGTKINACSYMWLLRGGGMTIAVDSGFDPKVGRIFDLNTVGDPETTIGETLGRLGTSPDKVDILIHTHLHYDHVGNDHLFENAAIYIQRRELETAAAPVYGLYYHRPDIARFVNEYWNRVTLLDGDEEIVPGIRSIFTGGHSLGHQAVYVTTGKGQAVITGDLLNLFENMETRSPNLLNVIDATRAVQRFKNECDIIIPSHDPEVVTRYGTRI
jgi:glyoxylase-like metal-dependent hydrolase (beta-lactamase superfamily II)